jgi:hypothetical protein
MALKKRIRRKIRRKAPAVRRPGGPNLAPANKGAASELIIGGVLDPAEKAADRMAGRALSGQTPTNTAATPAGGGAVQRSPGARSAPVAAPGAASAPATKSSASAVNAIGTGRSMSRSERAFFEPRFGRDFSNVRIHEGPNAARATRALDARAFAHGNDLAFAPGERTVQTMAHELAHVAQGDSPLRRDLALTPPGRTAEPPEMTDGEKSSAAQFNNQKFNSTNREWLLDIVGTAGRASFTQENIEDVRGFQADWRRSPDGKIGKSSLEPFGRETIAEGYRTRAIRLVVDGHNFGLKNVSRLFYDHTYTANNAITQAVTWGHKSTIKVGKPGVDQGYRGLVHTIAHEVDHANVFAGGAVSEPRFEFQGECVEIISSNMLRENIAGMMSDASRAWTKWQGMTTADKQAMWAMFQNARDVITRRYDALSAARQAPHTALVTNWRGQGAP